MNVKPLRLAMLILLFSMGAAYLYFSRSEPQRISSPAAGAAPHIAPKSAPAALHAPDAALVPDAEATRLLANPLERSEDLRAIYNQFKNSKNAAERYTAYRAWSACFPTFIAPQGQVISIDKLSQALPANEPNLNARIDAYRALQGRCKSFSDMSREQILNTTQQQQEAMNRGAILSPGEIAAKELSEGKPENALQLARAIVASQDPFAINSLREFIHQYAVLQIDAQTAHSEDRHDLRALAFSFAACHMGLECGPGSLTALQICASQGECNGGVIERYLQAMPNQADRDALLAESRRVLEAIRAGDVKALGL